MATQSRTDFGSLQRLLGALVATEGRSAVLQVSSAGGAGAIFIDGGRVCWAAVPETRRYLSDRLLDAQLTQHTIVPLLNEAKATGRPLGELLIAHGLIDADRFASVLYEHSVESILHMANSPISGIAVLSRPAGSFKLAFAASAIELIADVARRKLGLPKEPPNRLSADDLVVFSAVVCNDVLVPVQVSGKRQPTLAQATRLMAAGRDVMAVLQRGSVCFRRGERCWSVSGEPSAFTVSEGLSALSFSWMVMQAG